MRASCRLVGLRDAPEFELFIDDLFKRLKGERANSKTTIDKERRGPLNSHPPTILHILVDLVGREMGIQTSVELLLVEPELGRVFLECLPTELGGTLEKPVMVLPELPLP